MSVPPMTKTITKYTEFQQSNILIAEAPNTISISKNEILGTGTGGFATIDQPDTPITYQSSVNTCKSRGLLPFSMQFTRDGLVSQSSKNQAGTAQLEGFANNNPYFFYVGADSEGSPNCVRPTDYKISKDDNYDYFSDGWATNPGRGCIYRYRYGFYDSLSYNSLPGTAFWQNSFLFMTRQMGDVSQVLNGFTYYRWSPPFENSTFNETDYLIPYAPKGRLYLVAGYRDFDIQTLGMVDADADGAANPYEQSFFTDRLRVYCETQQYLNSGGGVPNFNAPTAQKVTSSQPKFRQGWKDNSWIQDHWYVIFAPIAGVMLILLIIILILCLCKRKQEPVEPLNPLVLRERVGKGYAYDNDEDEDDEEVYQGNYNTNMGYVNYGNYGNYGNYAPPARPEHQTRVGAGFNRTGSNYNGQKKNDDLDNTKAGAYSYNNTINPAQHAPREDTGDEFPETSGMMASAKPNEPQESTRAPTLRRRQSSNSRGRGRSAASDFGEVDIPEAGEIDESNANGDVELKKSAQQPEQQPVEEQKAPQEPARAPSMRRRHSSRLRGRTASSTFSEIDLPEAGEIDEANIDL